uniref:MFS transporter n=1 Tax=Cyberlindnera americana TaxID=36016 RepID=A0A5P8N8S9_9ASCO|nr:MFS transporter [Cyberlindnera americana]
MKEEENCKEEEIVSQNEMSQEDESVEEDPYSRYSPARKRVFVAVVALAVFLSPSSSMAFLPAAKDIASQFNTKVVTIHLSVAMYTVVMAISPCLAAPLGDIYGRRSMFLICTLGFTAASALTAESQNLAMFFVFRCVTALFGTAFFSLGGSVVGDIYIPQERGNAMGWTLLGSQLGPAFAPVIGGIIATYTSWRVIFWVLTGLGGLTGAAAFFFLPETSRNLKYKQVQKETGKKFVWVKFNPFTVAMSLRYPNLVLGGCMSMSLVYSMYSMTTPIPNVVDPRFGLNTPLQSSLFYLAPGCGYLLGSIFGGRWADRYVRLYIKLRGKRVPEDRLRSTHGSFIALPITILIYGWSIEKEVGGIPLPVIALFFNGVAQTFCFPSLNAYCIDCLPHLGGAGIASSYFTRFIAGAIGSATCLIQIEHIGVGWTSTISAFVLLGGYTACLVLITFGGKIREAALERDGIEI